MVKDCPAHYGLKLLVQDRNVQATTMDVRQQVVVGHKVKKNFILNVLANGCFTNIKLTIIRKKGGL